MSKEQRYTYYIDEFDWAIIDNTTDESYEYLEDIAKVLNEQDQKIKALEHRLSNCIEPKFKIGQEVWIVFDGVKKDIIENNWFLCSLEKSRLGLYEDCLFATEEEAKAKLEELKK